MGEDDAEGGKGRCGTQITTPLTVVNEMCGAQVQAERGATGFVILAQELEPRLNMTEL